MNGQPQPGYPQPGYPQQPYQQPQQGGGKMKWILIGCCGCLLLGILGFVALGGAGFWAIMKAAEPAKIEARAFMDKAGAGDAEGAYKHLSARFQQQLPLDQFKAQIQANQALFAISDMTINKVNIGEYQGEGVIRLQGTVQTKDGRTLNCLFRLVAEAGTWRLNQYLVRSDPIAETD